MPSTVEQLSPSKVKITVEVPFDELKPSMDKAYAQISQQIQVPGFRKGKVPARIIDQRVGRTSVIAEAFNSAFPQLYATAVTDNALVPLAQPEVAITRLEDGESIEFTAEVEVRPDFELPSREGLTAEVEAAVVGDEQVAEQLDQLRERFGTLGPVERAAEDGDIVVIDLSATQGGQQLADAAAEALSYRVGAGGMIDGLDEAVTGLSAGESATFTADLVGGEHAGEQAEITVTVSKVQVRELPEADDEFAQLASEYDSIDELRDNIHQRLSQMAIVDQLTDARDKVLSNYVAKADFEVPEGILAQQIEGRHQQILGQLAQSGLSLERYLTDGEDGKSEEDFWAEQDASTAEAVKAQIVLDRLVEASDIGVDQNDLTQHILRIAQQTRQSPDQVAQHMVEHDHVAEYMSEIRRGKALAALVAGATVTDSNGDAVDVSLADASQPAEPEIADDGEDDAETDADDVVEGDVVEGDVVEGQVADAEDSAAAWAAGSADDVVIEVEADEPEDAKV